MRNRSASRALSLTSTLLVVTLTLPCFAQEIGSSIKGAAKEKDEASLEVRQARESFKKGAELVAKAQWSEALLAFEESAKLRPHAITTYNIGACERALGRYTRARRTLNRAIEESERGGKQLPDGLASEAKAYLAEINRLLVQVELAVSPAEAAIAVDGRPLEKSDEIGSVPVFIGGLRAPGLGESVGSARFVAVLDPGAHVFTLSRKGFTDVVLNKSYAPGARASERLELDKLPGKIQIGATPTGASVVFASLDVGLTPLELARPAGEYDVLVRKLGYESYRTTVKVNPGEAITLNAKLQAEKRPLTSEWWFWTAVGVIVTGAAVGTYFAARSEPAPVRPPLDGGGLGWAVRAP
jgi:tetratricopeptide (TPR) repeat protein